METEKRPKSEVNLRKLMQKMGLGTNAFAEACGMSSQSMAQFLRNKSLTTASIYRIAMALDIDPRDMFFPNNEEEITSSSLDKEKQEKKEKITVNVIPEPFEKNRMEQEHMAIEKEQYR